MLKKIIFLFENIMKKQSNRWAAKRFLFPVFVSVEKVVYSSFLESSYDGPL